MPTAPLPHRSDQRPPAKRWVALLLASVFLHFVVLGWMNGNINLPLPKNHAEPVIKAQLHQAELSKPAPASPPKAVPPKPPVKAKPPARRTAPATPAITEPANAALPAPAEPPSVDLAEMTDAYRLLEGETPPEQAANVEPAVAEVPQETGIPEKNLSPFKINIPPSVELKYSVQALRDGQIVYGSGKISWDSDGEKYIVNGEASILFFTLLSFQSTGVIDDFGVAPVIYTEKRFRRPETNTHFHRERNTISFSASTATYPRKGGEQDRASVVWQLTGIGRSDSDKFKPGAEIELFVAGVRDGTPWRIRVINEEIIDVDGEKVTAWHVVRIPKKGSYDQKLDIWLAPQHEWYPVKLRFTETNGEYLDMLLSNLARLATN